jgi:hypothetical protein
MGCQYHVRRPNDHVFGMFALGTEKQVIMRTGMVVRVSGWGKGYVDWLHNFLLALENGAIGAQGTQMHAEKPSFSMRLCLVVVVCHIYATASSKLDRRIHATPIAGEAAMLIQCHRSPIPSPVGSTISPVPPCFPSNH